MPKINPTLKFWGILQFWTKWIKIRSLVLVDHGRDWLQLEIVYNSSILQPRYKKILSSDGEFQVQILKLDVLYSWLYSRLYSKVIIDLLFYFKYVYSIHQLE